MAKCDRNFGLEEVFALLPEDDEDSPLHDDTTLYQARKFWAHQISGEGDHCPVCGKWGKINAFNITGTLLRKLILLCDRSRGRSWVNTSAKEKKNLPGWFTGTNDHSKLQYWNLIEKDDTPGKNTKTVGMWRALTKGLRFARNQIQIPVTAFVYDEVVVGYSVQMTKASNIKTTGYNYWEEMRKTWLAAKMKFSR